MKKQPTTTPPPAKGKKDEPEVKRDFYEYPPEYEPNYDFTPVKEEDKLPEETFY